MSKKLLIVIIALPFIIFTTTIEYQNKQTYYCEVKDKWIKQDNNSENSKDKYMIQCDDKVYEITDLFFKFKFNSSDIYAKLEKNKKYKITTTGYRIPFLSWYQNINEVEELKGENNE